MKKINLTLVLILLALALSSCNTKNVIANKSDSSNIKFEYLYRGFATMHENEESNAYPKDTLVIQTEEDWVDFRDRYLPGIPYFSEIDFSKDCLVFSSIFPAKPLYSIGVDIKAFTLDENKLEVEYVDYGPPNGEANGIYAQNVDGITHCFVNLVKISKGNLSKNIDNIYHKK